MIFRSLLPWLTFWLVMSSCNDAVEPSRANLPSAVVEILERFEFEARQRGVRVDLSNVSVEFSALDEDRIGACRSDGNDHTVVIDTLSIYWGISGVLGHEELIFHELGHCILDRVHLEDRLENGDFKSIMRAVGDASYFENKLIDQNNSFRRDYYLDELFNPESPSPCWATDSFDPSRQEVFGEDFVNWRTMAVDGDGLLWLIGSLEVRWYNGTSFEIFSETNSSFVGRPLSLTANENGEIWLITADETTGRIYRIEEGLFVLVDEFANPSGFVFFVNQAIFDSTGKLWGAGFDGLFQFPLDGTVDQFNHTNTDLLEERINDITRLEAGELVVSQQSRLTRFDGERLSEIYDTGDQDIVAVEEVSGEIWFATEDQLLVYTGGEVTGQDMFALNAPFPGINGLNVDEDDHLWISCVAGLRKLENGLLSDFCQYSFGPVGINVQASRVDGLGNLWSYSRTSGLVRTTLP